LGFDAKHLYLSDSKSRVWQLEQHGGQSLWQQKELSYRQLTAPVVYQDFVVVGDSAGYVHWLSTRDGRQLGRIQVSDKPIDARPVVVDGVVYVYARDGELAAISATKK
jgi:outer membrane protein assembly factor BamB